MGDEFSGLSFDCANCKIKSYSLEEDNLTIECINGFSPANIDFNGVREFVPDERCIGGVIFGFRKKQEDGFTVFRLELRDAEIHHIDVTAETMKYTE